MSTFGTLRFGQSDLDSAPELVFHDDYPKKNRMKNYSADPVINQRLKAMAKRSEKKGLEFDLDEDWLVQKLGLQYCEVTGIMFKGEKLTEPFMRTIDRTNNNIGYTKENCKVVVWIYNQAKKDFDAEHVITMARALLDRS